MTKSCYLWAILPLLLCQCSPKYYTPNTQNVPLLQAKGQSNISLSGNANQIELQASTAVSDMIGLQLNGGIFFPSDLDNGNGGSGKVIEAGVGYYKPIGDNFVFETYGLLGFGNVENHLPSEVANNPGTTGDIKANIIRYGIQPNFGFVTKYLTAAISARFVALHYSNIEGSLIFEQEDQVIALEDQSNNFLIEPALTLTGGLERLKLKLQVMGSFNLSNSNFRQDNSLVSIGLQYHFRVKQ
ncbi:MAG: hypothetical protein ABIV51_05510 [Saprospiraceae bacterium]